MNGPHDLGGQMGFGSVAPEDDEPVFHADWEKRALGVTLCAGALGLWNIDESRHARESLHPADYYGSSYYEIWTKGLETLLQRHGLIDADELMAGQSLRQTSTATKPPLQATDVDKVLAKGGPSERPAESEARYRVGEIVRTKNVHPEGHTRLPRYARGRVGVIEEVAGAHVFPDDNAHGHGESPQWLYRVVFSGAELWGPQADADLTVSIDAWESYLDPA